MSDSSWDRPRLPMRSLLSDLGNTGGFRMPWPSGSDEFEITEMRSWLAAQGCQYVFRLTDYEVLNEWQRSRANHQISIQSNSSMASTRPESMDLLSWIEAEIRLLLRSPTPNMRRLIELFGRAVNVLEFLDKKKDKNAGLLYSGQFQVTPSGSRSRGGRGSLVNVSMRETALNYAKRRGKKPIDDTKGYLWLQQWDLERILGSAEELRVWQSASLQYVQSLNGRVIVFLANPELPDPEINNFTGVFRSVEGRALYDNPDVDRIFYRIEHAVRGVSKPVIGPKIVRGKQVFFLFSDVEP